MTPRDRLYTIRMSPEETERLDSLAAHYGLTSAGVIRMLVKREYDMLPGTAPTLHEAVRRRSLHEVLDKETAKSRRKKR